jgi:hypothetical protein
MSLPRRSGPRWHRILLCTLCVTYPSTLLAQVTPAAGAAPEDAEKRKEEAKVRFQRGLELVQNESWDAALAEFLASRKLFPTRVALKNAALSLRQLKRYVEALAMYTELLASFSASLSPEERKTVDDAITQLKLTVGEVHVESDQPGSTVVIDGQQQAGVTPMPAIAVNAGTHSVRISKEGYESFEAQVPVAGGQRESVKGKLKALSTIGRLVVRESAGKTLDVVVDGAVVGKTPRYEGVLAVGPHTVFLKGEGNWGTAPSQAIVKENQAATLTLSAVELDAEIRIEPVPANASVFVDGVQLGNGVWEGRLQSGSHQIEVAADGFVAYRKTITLSAEQKELLKLRLERDLSNPMWQAGFVPHLYLEVFGGAMLAPIGGFGGDANQACGDGKCSSGGLPLGFLAGARGGYQFIKGFSAELGAGFFYLGQELTRNGVEATADHGTLTSDNYKDRTTLAGPFVEISAAYTMLEKTPLTFRLGGGVARAKATFKNGGDFAGDVAHACDNEPDSCEEESVAVNARLAVPEKAPTFIMPFVAPEVRIGYRVTKKLLVDFGVTLFIMLPPQTERQPVANGSGGFTLRADQGRRANIGVVDGFASEPTSQNGGLATLPKENGFGVIMAVVPSLSGHFDF